LPEPERVVTVGIIGSGGIAGLHADYYKRIPYVRVAAVADIVPGRAQAFIERYGFQGARAYTDYRELLEREPEIQAVSVCTFNRAHHQPTVDALRAGKHVLLEKPLSVTLEEAVDMVRTARQTDRMLCVGFQSRFEPRVLTAQRIVASGRLGKVYYAETGGGRRKGIPGGTFVRRESAGGGAVLDIGCYSIDTAMFVLGNPRPLTVTAYTSNYFGTSPVYSKQAWGGGVDPATFDVEDFGVAMIRLEGDACLYFKISWAMHFDSLGRTFFLGTEGGLDMDAMRVYHDEFGLGVHTDVPLIETPWKDAWFRKVEAFAEAVRDGGPAPVPAEDVLRGQAILDAIYRSAQAKAEVRVEIPTV
jgi:predicted dehydrogenase